MSAVLPLGLAVLPSSWPVWVGVGVLGLAAGRAEAKGRLARRSATASRPWEPAMPTGWRGAGLLRTTGWAAEARGDRWRAPARFLFGRGGNDEIRKGPCPGSGLMVTGKGRGPRPGSLVAASLDVRVPDIARTPGSFDYRRFLAGRGLAWTAKATSWHVVQEDTLASNRGRGIIVGIRTQVLQSLDRILPPREAALAGAVLMGARGPDHRAIGATFTDLGLAHLFAVSGLHVGILLGLFTLPGRLLGLGPGGRYLPLVIILPAYMVLTGMPGSVVRAAGLGLLALATPWLGTRSRPRHLLGILFWAGCVWEPAQVLDTGMQLSYLAAGGILTVSGLTDGFRFQRGRVLSVLVTGLSVSMAAQWFTLPVVAASFGRISLLSPLANLVVVPLFGVAVWLTAGGVILDLMIPWAGKALGAMAWLVFRLLAVGVHGVSGVSGGFPLGLPIPSLTALAGWLGLTIGGLLILSHRPEGGRPSWTLPALSAIIVSGLVILGPASRSFSRFDGVTLMTFDVGQGDCSLMALPDGWTLMIDTGGVMGQPGPLAESLIARSVLPFLVRQGVDRLDAVVLTHGHLDHTGGTMALYQALEVGRWYGGGRALQAVRDSLAERHQPEPGKHLVHQSGPWTVELLVPEPPTGDHVNENDFSLVTVLSHDGRPVALLSGDLEEEGEGRLLEAGLVPRDIQIWKAGHHGSATSGSPEFLGALDPRLIVISCGVGNKYGHPSHGPYVSGSDTIAVVRTDLQGSVQLRWTANGELVAP